MLALDIQINHCKRLVFTADDLAYVRLSYSSSNCDLNSITIKGTDDSFFYTWLDDKIQNGDTFSIQVVDVDKELISSPQFIKKNNRKKMKQDFERLKIELQSKQLL